MPRVAACHLVTGDVLIIAGEQARVLRREPRDGRPDLTFLEMTARTGLTAEHYARIGVETTQRRLVGTSTPPFLFQCPNDLLLDVASLGPRHA